MPTQRKAIWGSEKAFSLEPNGPLTKNQQNAAFYFAKKAFNLSFPYISSDALLLR